MQLFQRLRTAVAVALGFDTRWAQTDLDPYERLWTVTGGPGANLPRDTKKWLLTWRRNPRLRAVANRIASDVAKTEMCLLRDRRDGKSEEVLKHPFLDYMAEPWKTNGGSSWGSLIGLTQSYRDIDGNAFWLNRWTGDPWPSESWPIPPHWVTKFPEPGDTDYWINLPFEEIPRTVPYELVSWFKEFDLFDPYGRGTGIATCVDDEITQEEYATKYNSAMFRNGGRPDVLISVGQSDPKVPVDTKRLAAIQKDWEQRHTGFWNAFKASFLTGDVRVQTLGQSHREMEFLEGRKFNRDVIFQAFGLPPEIMGVVENSNRATAEAALYMYSLQVILPRLISLVYDLNRLIVPMWDTKVYLGFENPVQETEQFKLDKAVELFKAGAINRDEAREATDFDPIGGELGAEFLQPSNTITIGIGGEKKKDKDEKPEATKAEKTRTLLVPVSGNRFVERKVVKAA